MEYTHGKQWLVINVLQASKYNVTDMSRKRKDNQSVWRHLYPSVISVRSTTATLVHPRNGKMCTHRYLLSKGMSADSLVCRHCKHNVTHALADPSNTPRWEKRRKRGKGVCFVLINTQLHICMHATISSTELPQNKKFQTKPLHTPLQAPLSHSITNMAMELVDACRQKMIQTLSIT